MTLNEKIEKYARLVAKGVDAEDNAIMLNHLLRLKAEKMIYEATEMTIVGDAVIVR